MTMIICMGAALWPGKLSVWDPKSDVSSDVVYALGERKRQTTPMVHPSFDWEVRELEGKPHNQIMTSTVSNDHKMKLPAEN